MRARTVGRLGALGLLLALLLSTARPVGAEPRVESAPTGTPGVFEFVATGFAAHEMVSTWLTGPSQQVVATSRHKVDNRGAIGFTLRLKRHLEPGRWAITVGGWESGREAITTFDAPVRVPDINLAVSPPDGPAGTTFTFAATGFEEGERVSYWLTGPDGRAVDGDWLKAGRVGRVEFAVSMNADVPRGQWVMTAYGQSSDRLGMVSFIVS
jgi:hypothetical protein